MDELEAEHRRTINCIKKILIVLNRVLKCDVINIKIFEIMNLLRCLK